MFDEPNKTYGLCFGGYCPMHQGHLDLIMKAKKENDVCIVVVCGYNNEPRAQELRLSLSERYSIIKKHFKDDEQIVVIHINDDSLGIDQSMCPNNWKIWVNAVRQKIQDKGICQYNQELTFYVAEEYYKHELESLGEHVDLSERKNPISGTLVRKHPLKYWNYILKPFREYMTYNILVVGTASEGKSTLVRDISTYFGIPYAEEYGRTYMEETGKVDDDLNEKDFSRFIENQVKLCWNAMQTTPNGVMISDTDMAVTLMYAHEYAGQNYYDLTEEGFQNIVMKEADYYRGKIRWDVIFFLTPNNKFVDDGCRNMRQSSMEERQKNEKVLKMYVSKIYGTEIPIIYLKGGEFLNNFNAVKNHINEIFEQK